MQKIRLTAVLAALGLFAASQVAFAGTLTSSLGNQPAAPGTIVLAIGHGGHGGAGGGYGGGFGGGFGGFGGKAAGIGGYSGHPAFAPGGGRFAHRGHFRGRRRFFGGPFIGWGYDYDYPYWYDSGSCYWNCRNSGYGPGYCRAYAYNFCY
ncbi:MAG: hypothetical protein ACLPWS_10170 [Rhodomicrobium sp.]